MSTDIENQVPQENQTPQGRPVLSGRTGSDSSQVLPKKNIKIGRHGAEMMMTSDPRKDEQMLSRVGVPEGVPVPATLEERVRLVKQIISQSMGISIPEGEVPDRIGFDISTDSQRRLLLGVLELMTDSDYRGDYMIPNEQVLTKSVRQTQTTKEPVKKMMTDGYKTSSTGVQIGGPYQNISSTPVVRITDRDLMLRCGFDPDSHNDRDNFKKAKTDLCFKRSFLMWTRFARDKKGNPIRDRNGRTQFELVSTFSSVLNLNVVSDPQTKQILYNEISPAPVFLDEISREYGGVNGGYFLLVPPDCTEEITQAYRKRTGKKYGSTPSVIQSLCWWFRLKVQDIQQRDRNPFTKHKGDPTLRIEFSDLCRELDYGEATIRKNKSRIKRDLDEGIQIAQDLGYITESSFDMFTDEYVFELNLDYYPNQYRREGETPISEAPVEGPQPD